MKKDIKYEIKFKYTGDSVGSGTMDADKLVCAVQGFNDVIKHLFDYTFPDIKSVNKKVSIPVTINSGSIELIIQHLDDILNLATTVAIWRFFKPYLDATFVKAANDGLSSTGAYKDSAQMIRKVFQLLLWVVKVVKHIGSFHIEKNKIKKDKGGQIVIYNSNDESVAIPIDVYKFLETCPDSILSKCASVVDSNTDLQIMIPNQTSVSITNKDKGLFVHNEELESEYLILPELTHNKKVKLSGTISRVNENSNDLGFTYKGHTIKCKPQNGNITSFKNDIVSQNESVLSHNVEITGIVNRADTKGGFKAYKPEIFFTDIKSNESLTPHIFNYKD